MISKNNVTVLIGFRRKNLYFLEGSIIFGQTNVIKEVGNTQLWLEGLAHVGLKGLQDLVKQNLLKGGGITKQE